jgi:hypothetical protein
VWVAVLAGLFMLFTGQWTAVNWVGAAAAGAVSGLLTIPLTRTGLFDFRFRVGWLRQVPAALAQVPFDFVLVMAALVPPLTGRRREPGRFVARGGFPVDARNPEATARRAFVAYLATWSPNSYVVDIDPDSGNRLAHDLIPRRSSERPA